MSSRERRNSCGLSSCRTADVSAVATNMTLSKHEGQHQQSRRPCDHHSQQEPLVGFHGSVPPLPIWYNWNKSDAVPLEPPLSPKNETAGPHQFRRWTRVYVNHIYWPPPITSGERLLQYPGTNGSLVASDGKFQPRSEIFGSTAPTCSQSEPVRLEFSLQCWVLPPPWVVRK
jgi:hypothetical protein